MDTHTQEDRKLSQRGPVGDSGLGPKAWPKVQGVTLPLLMPKVTQVPLSGVPSSPTAAFLKSLLMKNTHT